MSATVRATDTNDRRYRIHKSRIELLVDNILPALDGLDGSQPPEALLHSAVEANVRWTVRSLLDTPEAKANPATSGMKLVGAIYELETGRVHVLDDLGERL